MRFQATWQCSATKRMAENGSRSCEIRNEPKITCSRQQHYNENPIERASTTYNVLAQVQRTCTGTTYLHKYNVLSRCAPRSMCNVPQANVHCATRTSMRRACARGGTSLQRLRQTELRAHDAGRVAKANGVREEVRLEVLRVPCVPHRTVGCCCSRSYDPTPVAVLTSRPTVVHHTGTYAWKRYPLCRMTTTVYKAFE